MRVLCPILFFACLVLACQNRPKEPAVPTAPPLPPLRERLVKTWILADYRSLRAGTAPSENQKEKLLDNRVLFHFFPDGQWAFIEGEAYHNGRWTLDEHNNKIRCTYPGRDSALVLSIKIRRLTTDSLTADLSRNEQTLSATLETDGIEYSNPEKCPWHPVNNAWRIPPNHAETDAEIRTRAINHLRHYYTLLDAALTNSPHTVNIKNSPSCIQIYESGIGLRDPDTSWYTTFYDRRDAEKCFQLYSKMMNEDGVFTGPKTRNWISDDVTLLQRMMNRLQEKK